MTTESQIDLVSPRVADDALPVAGTPAVLCQDVVKRFYVYEHRTRSMRELFVRSVLRRPIHVRRPQFTLRGFSLHVDRGESVALVGANGSGKSTALRLIAGIYQPSSGVVRTTGRVTAIIDLGVGFHAELTGIENVAQYAAALGLGRREIAARIDDILAFADIGAFITEPMKFYSSGMRARLAFAVATLCVEPDILLVDEALAVGDHNFRERCIERLREFHRNGGTLVFVSHDVDTVRQLCKRAVWLDHGELRMDGDVDAVIAAYVGTSAQ